MHVVCLPHACVLGLRGCMSSIVPLMHCLLLIILQIFHSAILILNLADLGL